MKYMKSTKVFDADFQSFLNHGWTRIDTNYFRRDYWIYMTFGHRGGGTLIPLIEMIF